MKFFSVILILSLASSFAGADGVKAKLALNWKAETEFGGFYEAQAKNYFRTNGFDVEILEGGSGTPTLQMLISGQVDYAIVSAEEILLHNAKDAKNRIVAVFSVFEKSPYMIMAREDQGLKSLREVFQNPKITISLQKGLPYVEYLLKKFAPVQAQIVPYGGGITLFEKTPNLAQQGFMTSEFLLAQNQKLKPQAWLVADEGFNPYITVLAVREDRLVQKSEEIGKFVSASRDGWVTYYREPGSTNELMHKKNPSMSVEMLGQSLKKMQDFIQPMPGPKMKYGQMTKERWEALGKQMLDLKLIPKLPEADKNFRNF